MRANLCIFEFHLALNADVDECHDIDCGGGEDILALRLGVYVVVYRGANRRGCVFCCKWCVSQIIHTLFQHELRREMPSTSWS